MSQKPTIEQIVHAMPVIEFLWRAAIVFGILYGPYAFLLHTNHIFAVLLYTHFMALVGAVGVACYIALSTGGNFVKSKDIPSQRPEA